MRSPYDLEMSETCHGCRFCAERLFRDLPASILHSFDAIKTLSLYPKGATLFVEGQQPRGVFVLCAGRVKLTESSPEGKTVIVRLAEPGEVLGLSATISGDLYHLTAETTEPCQADFVRREDFLRYLREQPEVCLRVIEMLSEILRAAHVQIRSFGKTHSAAARLARLLLCWSEQMGDRTHEDIHLKLPLTHQEIAQMIGTSRETVSRLLGELRQQQIISLNGSGLLINDSDALSAKANH
ncbi:MAG: Crp/Fnr family transcriptional regulator [Blastocatellales bacterium]